MAQTKQGERGSVVLGLLAGLTLAASAGGGFWLFQRRRLNVLDLTSASPIDKRSKRASTLDGVTLHAMGFSRGNDPRDYEKVTAHFVVLPNGTVAQLHPVSSRLPASMGFNDRTIAIEFAGNFASTRGLFYKPDQFGRDRLTQQQIDAGRKLLRKLRSEHGIRFVFAHRQSDPDRQNDPGPEVWSQVGQWAVRELELSDGGPGFKIDEGLPIPVEWRQP